jgi:hypothetical protein
MDLLEAKNELRSKATAFAEKVAPLYQQLGWEWKPHEESFIPTETDILDTILDLINGLTPEFPANGTGGLDVYYKDPSEEECGHFGLRFTVEDDTSFD